MIEKEITLFCDFDGTLSDFVLDPEDATVPHATLQDLSALQSHPSIDLIILSGRPLTFLQKQFPRHFKLAGEYGSQTNFAYSHFNKVEMPSNAQEKLMQLENRHPQSHIEKKEHSWVWHYRSLKESLSSQLLSTYFNELTETVRNTTFSVHNYNCVLEIKRNDISKAKFVESYIQSHPKNFYLAFGDDVADESFFAMIPKKQGHTFAIGDVISKADFYFEGPKFLRSFILHLKQQLQAQMQETLSY